MKDMIKFYIKIVIIMFSIIFILTACNNSKENNQSSELLNRCEPIEDINLKDLCYQSASRILLEFSICDKMTQESIKGSCYGYIIIRKKLEFSGCENSDSQDFIDNCYNVIAVSTGDINHCLKIQNDDLKEACLTYRTF